MVDMLGIKILPMRTAQPGLSPVSIEAFVHLDWIRGDAIEEGIFFPIDAEVQKQRQLGFDPRAGIDHSGASHIAPTITQRICDPQRDGRALAIASDQWHLFGKGLRKLIRIIGRQSLGVVISIRRGALDLVQ
nr:hypothetical protein [Aliiroseovarius marinus]